MFNNISSPGGGREGINRARTIQSNRSVGRLGERDLNRVDSFVKEDKESDKTFARRWVEKRFAKFEWYNPNKNNPNKALDIKKGWAFYEHYTLARYDVDRLRDAKLYQHVDPVMDKESKVYSFFSTPKSAYPEWGIGVALYFNALEKFSLVLLLAGLFSIPNMLYYSQSEYQSIDDFSFKDQGYFLWGSAICNSTEWVTCDADFCDTKLMSNRSEPIKFATPMDDSVTETFVQRSLCNGGTNKTIGFNFVTLLVLFILTFIFYYYQKLLAVRYDEDSLTASDYSILIKNPPSNALNPDEWRTHFIEVLRRCNHPYPHVAAVTVVLNNELLIINLINRRICRNELRKLLPGTNIDDVQVLMEDVKKHIAERDEKCRSLFELLFTFTIRPIFKLINRFVPMEELLDKIKFYSDNVKDFQEKEYSASSVLITFEREDEQRDVLRTLQEGRLQVKANRCSEGNTVNRFRNEHVLDVSHPTEPNAVRYLDLSTSPMSKLIRQLITLAVTSGLVALSAWGVQAPRNSSALASSLGAGILISALNLIIPRIVSLLLLLEKHDTEGERQRSLYLKVTIYRWLLTVFMTKALSDFDLSISNDDRALLPAVRGIFLSEMFLVPILRVLDFGGSLSKHYFGPRAKTPDQMYLCFKGSPYNLAERYTDLTKVVFLSYFFSALYPTTLFFGSLAIFLRQYSDRFLLLRTWRAAPHFGTKLATFSTRYFLILAVVFATYGSATGFAFFRYDNICASDQVNAQNFTNINVTLSTGASEVINVTSGIFARVCTEDSCCQDQTVSNDLGFIAPWEIFPPNHRKRDFKWLSEPLTTQDPRVTFMYALTAFIMVLGYILLNFWKSSIRLVHSLYAGVYDESDQGSNQFIDFSSVNGIDGYIPELTHGRFPHPLLFCNVDDIEKDSIGWTPYDGDPENDSAHDLYKAHNLIYDIDEINNSSDLTENNEVGVNNPTNNPPLSHGPLFSVVKQYKRDFSKEIAEEYDI